MLIFYLKLTCLNLHIAATLFMQDGRWWSTINVGAAKRIFQYGRIFGTYNNLVYMILWINFQAPVSSPCRISFDKYNTSLDQLLEDELDSGNVLSSHYNNDINDKKHLSSLPNTSGSEPLDPDGGSEAKRWLSTGWFRHVVHFSHVISASNIMNFPYLCAKHGGGNKCVFMNMKLKMEYLAAFVIPYIISYVFVGVPLLYAEMGLGQFSSLQPIEIFRRINPALGGDFILDQV